MKEANTPRKFVREYMDDTNKKVMSRWHYDYSITKSGPVLVEEFGLPSKERKKRSGNKVAEQSES